MERERERGRKGVGKQELMKRPPQSTDLLRTGILHNLGTQVTAFDGPQVLSKKRAKTLIISHTIHCKTQKIYEHSLYWNRCLSSKSHFLSLNV